MKKLKNIYKKFRELRNYRSLGSLGSLMTIGFLTGFLLVSCSDKSIGEEPDNNLGNVDGDSFKISFRYYLPEGVSTRSGTEDGGGSEHGIEDGTVNENAINAKLYFTDMNNELYSDLVIEFSEGSSGTLTAEIDPKELIRLFGNKVKLFLVSNAGDLSDLDQSFGNGILDFAQEGTTGENEDHGQNGKKVPIANKSMFIIDFNFEGASTFNGTTASEALAALRKLPNNAFTESGTNRHLDLSKLAVEVKADGTAGGFLTNENERKMQLERLVARVDYKPVTAFDVDGKKLEKENLYPIGKIPNLYAQMTDLQIFNVSKSAHVFRHTSEGNKEKAGETKSIFGIENNNSTFNPDIKEEDKQPGVNYTSYTWMADDDWTKKNEFYGESKDETATSPWPGPWTSNNNSSTKNYNYFHNQPRLDKTNPIYTENGDAYYTITKDTYLDGDSFAEAISITSLTNRTPSEISTRGTYYPWCYITENTLPSTESMIKGLCTGIAFKMFLCKKDGTTLDPDADFISRDAYLNAVKGLAEEEAKKKDEQNETDINNYKAQLAKVQGSLTQVGSSNYYKLVIGEDECYAEKEGDKYYITYWYYFRHNLKTPHVTGTVDPMQFAVVRNNIYKISVTSLNGLPEPYEPEEPAEPQEEYISVEINILSWAREDREWEL